MTLRTRVPTSTGSSGVHDDGAVPLLGLLTREAGGAFSILAHQRARRAPGGVRPRKPRIDEGAIDKYPAGAEEIGAAVLAADGSIVASFGFSPNGRAIHERRGPAADGRLQRWPGRQKIDVRKLHVPIPDDGDFVLLYRSQVRQTSTGKRLVRTPLSYLRLQRGPAPTGLPQAPSSIPLLGLGPLPAVEGVTFATTAQPLGAPIGGTPAPNGTLEPPKSLFPGRSPTDHFDIVILGDGYSTAADLARFESQWKVLVASLASMEPFKSRSAKLNFHVITAISDESGITDPLDPTGAVVRKTYFWFQTDAEGNGIRWIIGTPYPQIVMDAASHIAPWSQIDAVVMIVNLDLDTAHAWPDQRLVAVAQAAGESDAVFCQTAAHELGHVIAGLADEYICCDPYDGVERFPNMATAADLAARSEPWRPLAQPADFDKQGNFKIIHAYGDTLDAWSQPSPAAKYQGRLGAFWGCEFTDPPENVADACGFADSRGAKFYRPMAECRMRGVDWEFCPACADAITDAIDSI